MSIRARYIEALESALLEVYLTPHSRSAAAVAPRLADVLLALDGLAVVELPERPSEYWGPNSEPQWNHYPFTRVNGREVEVGARCEHVYRINPHEARIHAADLLEAANLAENGAES
ncbi:hypothetical protein PBI_GAIA_50 [Mycobacterium phage Gaia]|uniref:Uncharacterized protein n=1 Tax=Mycobacterium phage Gaia TaxID=1486472 RepID=A0A068F8N7_9CAUD|nr:hypothetical protein VC46_gp050 [Mycobacterium phage Gaia]AID58870.1 hypothetical protein PBI_GAIA_50 [Mycobacterium phage Gaia]AYQ99995.1 hypothetical protein PBI_NEBKISS_54 [Mycobacterium phage Nebkiss]